MQKDEKPAACRLQLSLDLLTLPPADGLECSKKSRPVEAGKTTKNKNASIMESQTSKLIISVRSYAAEKCQVGWTDGRNELL